jgi:PAS domain S-box-containing protein
MELLARVTSQLRGAGMRRESERQLREFADAAPAMLWISDTSEQCTFLSRGWYEYTGQSEAEALGLGWADAIHPEDRPQAIATFLAASRARGPFAIEYRVRRADGEYRWAIDAGRPRFDGRGEWLGYVGSVIDVHDRKRVQDLLDQSERRLRSVADHVPVMIGYVDRDGYYRFANAHYVEWFGENPAGRHVRDALGEEAYRQRLPFIERVLRGETLRFEGPTPHRALGPRDTEMAYVPDVGPDGAVQGFYVRVVDITDRKRVEAALRLQSERLRLLWEAAGIILASDDPDTMLKQVFTKIASGLGVDTYFNFMVDPSDESLRLVSCTGIGEEEARSLSRLELGQAVCGTVALERRPIVATHIQSSDDPKVQLVKSFGLRAYACNPLLAGGTLLGTLSFASRTRDQFTPDEIEFLETISHYVTAAYRQMRLIAQLREADRRKDEFLATLAHELRNPLAPICTALHVIRIGRGAAMESSLGVMERQTAQLTRLIDDLLDVSRITRGKLQVRKAVLDVTTALQSAIETSRPFIDEAKHRFDVQLPPEPLFVDGDLTRLAQVFANLLSNAAKYTPEGGRIALTAARQGNEVVVSVRDNGIGIPEGMQERVFEMFTQLDRTPERGYPGLGIGLTLVKSLVEMHGGTVAVASRGPGTGSEFAVRLPLVAAGPPVAAREPDSRAQRARRVLVADDNEDAARLLGMSLRLEGHDVRTVHDGAQAVATAAEFQPDIVLLDLGMPRMNGLEAARHIRAQRGGEKVTLIALTGWGQEEDKRRTREAGFDHHWTKPVSTALLEAILRE